MGLSNICRWLDAAQWKQIYGTEVLQDSFTFFRTLTHTHNINQQSIYLQAAGIPYGVRENRQNTTHMLTSAVRPGHPLPASWSGVSDSARLRRQSAHRILLQSAASPCLSLLELCRLHMCNLFLVAWNIHTLHI